MFSACRNQQTTSMTYSARHVSGLIALLVAATLLASCSKRSTPEVQEPWVTEGQVVRGETNAGGIATDYAAYFDDAQLTKIIETRKTARASHGEYSFTGARLVGYRGDAIASDASIELSFDMKGVLTSSSGNPPTQEIAALRNRAQLLRSLVLARRSSTDHSESSTAKAVPRQ